MISVVADQGTEVASQPSIRYRAAYEQGRAFRALEQLIGAPRRLSRRRIVRRCDPQRHFERRKFARRPILPKSPYSPASHRPLAAAHPPASASSPALERRLGSPLARSRLPVLLVVGCSRLQLRLRWDRRQRHSVHLRWKISTEATFAIEFRCLGLGIRRCLWGSIMATGVEPKVFAVRQCASARTVIAKRPRPK